MPRLAGWRLAQNKLSRTVEFQDFVQSLSFVNSLVAYFEQLIIIPTCASPTAKVTFELTRYDMGGKVTRPRRRGGEEDLLHVSNATATPIDDSVSGVESGCCRFRRFRRGPAGGEAAAVTGSANSSI